MLQILVRITFFALILVKVQANIFDNLQNDDEDILLSVIQENCYDKLIFHVDNTLNRYRLNRFDSRNKEILVINYSNLIDKYGIIQRPNGYNYLNLILLQNPADFTLYAQQQSNLRQVDTVVFEVENEQAIEDLLEIDALKNVGSVVFYERNEKNFYAVQYFSGNESKTFKEVLFNVKTEANLRNSSVNTQSEASLKPSVKEQSSTKSKIFYNSQISISQQATISKQISVNPQNSISQQMAISPNISISNENSTNCTNLLISRPNLNITSFKTKNTMQFNTSIAKQNSINSQALNSQQISASPQNYDLKHSIQPTISPHDATGTSIRTSKFIKRQNSISYQNSFKSKTLLEFQALISSQVSASSRNYNLKNSIRSSRRTPIRRSRNPKRQISISHQNSFNLRSLINTQATINPKAMNKTNISIIKLETSLQYKTSNGSSLNASKITVNLRNVFNNFTNFNGYNFHIGFAEYIPFVYCNKNSAAVSPYRCNLDGSETKILREMSKRLNFTFTLIQYTNSRDGNWVKMVKEVNQSKIDFAIGGLTASYERYELTDFTAYVFMEVYESLYAISDRNVIDWGYVIKPFQFSTWYCVLGFFIVLCFSLKIFYWLIECQSVDNSYTLLLATRIFMEQSSPMLSKRKFSLRLLFSLIYLFSFNVTYTYKTKLTSNTITKKLTYPDTLEDLLARQYKFQVNSDDWSILHDKLSGSRDPIHLQILQNFNDDLNYCDIIRRVLNYPVAFIEEKYYLTTQLLSNCSDYYDAKDVNYMRITTENLFPSNHGWSIQKFVPYKEQFSKFITSLFECGITQMWYRIITKYSIKTSNEIDKDLEMSGMNMKKLLECLYLLLFGLTLSFIMFLCELIKFKCNKTD